MLWIGVDNWWLISCVIFHYQKASCGHVRIEGISLSFIVSPLSCKKLLMHLITFISNPKSYNLGSSPLYHTWSKAFSTSKNTTMEIILLLKFCLIQWLCKFKQIVICVHLFFLKPFCFKLNILWFSAQLLILFVSNFSRIFPMHEVRLNGLFAYKTLFCS